ncbi:hypothetical protein CC1G_08289 [Coprinopsis cinerea okayama7|uniref:Uncharacterized protein n=1 Tax=Coprinopsis cinerea (strain Okayama-7 / 130 / ATCC MYA-4618 / FGSC 9003) TaxID=240176 RepID=A8PG46_COPC7|nr:hypothetical protein CC1G_08289 [Coprinopsis cinerea okayama7\|eukprot:XP_001841145.2 hypothetical protein CC1G_08289 [Coprinopsis cinerea okayama7\
MVKACTKGQKKGAVSRQKPVKSGTASVPRSIKRRAPSEKLPPDTVFPPIDRPSDASADYTIPVDLKGEETGKRATQTAESKLRWILAILFLWVDFTEEPKVFGTQVYCMACRLKIALDSRTKVDTPAEWYLNNLYKHLRTEGHKRMEKRWRRENLGRPCDKEQPVPQAPRPIHPTGSVVQRCRFGKPISPLLSPSTPHPSAQPTYRCSTLIELLSYGYTTNGQETATLQIRPGPELRRDHYPALRRPDDMQVGFVARYQPLCTYGTASAMWR